MLEEIRIGCLGTWAGHAIEFSKEIQEREQCKLIAVWDSNEEVGKDWADEVGCDFEADYRDLILRNDIDAVIVTSELAYHKELIVFAANAKKHVFVEKPLCIRREEAYEIQNAVIKNKIHFTMCDPFIFPSIQYARELSDEGKFGEITEVRSRVGHNFILDKPYEEKLYNKKATGGGAMIDIGCHAIHLLHWMLGQPDKVAGVFHPFTEAGKKKDIDETSTLLFEFPGNKIGIAEAGWVTPECQYEFNIYGTRGTAQATREHLRYCVDGEDWVDVPDERLPEPWPFPLDYWIESIINDSPNKLYEINEAVEIAEMIDAAYQSNGKLSPVISSKTGNRN